MEAGWKVLNEPKIIISTKADRKSSGASETRLWNSSSSNVMMSPITETQVHSSQAWMYKNHHI